MKPLIDPDATELIGGTPLVTLGRLHPGPGRILAKAEFLNPGGSIKDRAARQAVRGAIQRGELARGQQVVELTSGNMGAGLALVCASLGFPFAAVMSRGNSPQRVAMLRALGAEVVLVDQVEGTAGRVTGCDLEAVRLRALELVRERNAFYVDQFNNPDCVDAHLDTGEEIWEQCAGAVHAFVAAVGTGATLVGVARYLKRRNPNILCVAVEPASARVLAGEAVRDPRHLLQGAGYAMTPPRWDPALIDGFEGVSDEEAESVRRALGHREGLHVGYTAAANVCAAKRLLESGRLAENASVVTVLCDTGLKYPMAQRD